MKRILFVSIAFPPKNDPECLQVARYLKYMLKEDMVMDIVTSALPTLFMPYDEGLEAYCAREVTKVEIPIWETKISNFFLRKIIPGGIRYPDSKFTFYWQAKKATRRLKHTPDVIYSRSNPLSSALMAFRLQEHYHVPWVMHLSDPWVGSPAVNYSEKEFRFNVKWERRCLEKADRISFTTERTLDFYKDRYPELGKKFFVSPNVFDPEEGKQKPLSFQEPLRIVYTGGLSGDRSAEFFLRACLEVWKENPGIRESKIIFAGPIDRRNRKIFKQFALPFVKHIGEVSYAEARTLQQGAHILLTIDQPLEDPKKGMFFPSKILDYVLVKRKILALTNPGSSTEMIVSALNSVIVRYPEIDLLKEFLISAMCAYDRRDVSFFISEETLPDFNASHNSKKLASILKSL